MKSFKLSSLIAVGLVLLLVVPAQSQFVKTLGGAYSDLGYSVIEGFDGGIYVTGYSNSFSAENDEDLLLAKFDAAGNSLWTRTLGLGNDERGNCLIQTSDSGIVAAGYSNSILGLLLTKFNSSGDLIWARVLMEGYPKLYQGTSLIEASDSAIIVAGYIIGFTIPHEFLVARYDASGNLIWVKTLDVGGGYAYSVIETYDGGIVVTGDNGFDLVLAKFGAAGNLIWTTLLEGSSKIIGKSVIEASDHGLVVTGWTDSFGAGEWDIHLSKFDASGNPLWTRTLGGFSTEEAYTVIETSDSGLVIIGRTTSYGEGGSDLLLAKFSSTGTLLWTRVLGGTSADYGLSVTELSDGELIATGRTNSFGAGSLDILLARFDAFGNTCMGGFVTLDTQTVTPSVTHPSLTPITPPAIDTTITFTVTALHPAVMFVCGHEPKITSISDVGNDQGRQVRVKWNRCYYDSVGSPTGITEYNIWRRVDQYKGSSPGHNFVIKEVESLDFMLQNVINSKFGDRYLITKTGDLWDFIATVPAMQVSEYSYVAPTLADSTQREGMYWSVFFVSAHTADPNRHFQSDPDSGYSLDNIPPLPIHDLEVNPRSWFTLLWTVPGEYVGEHPISTYDIRYSTVPVGADTQAWWNSATACSGEGFYNYTVGAEDSIKVARESWNHPHCYFAIKGLDDRPNPSESSNFYHFICGDVTANGLVDLGDVVYLITYQYKGGPPPKPLASGDCTCNGVVDLGDVVYLISYQYRGGPPPCSQH
jgi:hypothetical protein